VAYLEGATFSECAALENIYVNSDNAYFMSIGGVLYSKDAKLLLKYPAGRSGEFDMTDGYESTMGIGANAFANATNLTYIVLPNSLMFIDSTAFINCEQLNKVEFTGTTPPVLMGAGIFDTSVEDFVMIIPDAFVDAYLKAYNFAEYESYVN
jgi:hypothetical protein